ncbi:hypothetical protein D3C80_2038750 [compost metagenome]
MSVKEVLRDRKASEKTHGPCQIGYERFDVHGAVPVLTEFKRGDYRLFLKDSPTMRGATKTDLPEKYKFPE